MIKLIIGPEERKRDADSCPDRTVTQEHLLADDFPTQYCGGPFYLSGEIRIGIASLIGPGSMDYHPRCQEATKIDALGKKVLATDREGKVGDSSIIQVGDRNRRRPGRAPSSPWDPVQMAAHRWAADLRLEKVEEMCKQ